MKQCIIEIVKAFAQDLSYVLKRPIQKEKNTNNMTIM